MRTKLLLHSCLVLSLLYFYCKTNLDSISTDNLRPSQYQYLAGSITDNMALIPIESATVELLLSGKLTNTDSSGFFSFDSLLGTNDTLYISAAGYTPLSMPVEFESDSTRIDLNLNRVAENQVLYVGAYGGGDLYIVDVNLQEKTDSLHTALGSIGNFSITPGGTKLYISQIDGGENLILFNTRDKIFVSTSLANGFMRFDRLNNVYLFSSNGIFTVDTVSNTGTLADTITNISNAEISKISDILYFTKLFGSYLYYYNLNENTVFDSVRTDIRRMVLKNNEESIYCLSNSGEIYNLDPHTKTTQTLGYVNRRSNFAITSDDRYMLVTDPGGYLLPPPPSGLISIFDLTSNAFSKFIDISALQTESLLTDRIVITKSGNYAFVSDWLSNVFILDLRRSEAIGVLGFSPLSSQIIPLALGP